MKSIGPYLRKLRLDKGDTIQEIASNLDIEPDLLYNIEKGQANATKIQVVKFASYFGIDEKEMLITYQCNRILSEIGDNEITEGAVQKGKTMSCLLKSKEKASRRYQNMMHELLQLLNGQMDVKFHKPSYPLNQYIESMVYYSGHNLDYTYEKILPDGVVQLFIELDGIERVLISGNDNRSKQLLKDAWVTGIQKRHITYLLERSETTLCIRFTPGSFYTLTDIPQSDIEDSTVDATLIFGQSISGLKERILHCSKVQDIFQVVEHYFMDKVKQENTEHPIIRYMYQNIDIPLSKLVQKTGYSQKHLIHLFKKHIGLTPKYFQRIYRFNKALNDLQAMPYELDWQHIVFNNNYYDQAHFIKEFNHFSGISPQSYMEAGGTCPKFVRIRSHR